MGYIDHSQCGAFGFTPLSELKTLDQCCFACIADNSRVLGYIMMHYNYYSRKYKLIAMKNILRPKQNHWESKMHTIPVYIRK